MFRVHGLGFQCLGVRVCGSKLSGLVYSRVSLSGMGSGDTVNLECFYYVQVQCFLDCSVDAEIVVSLDIYIIIYIYIYINL